MSSIERLDIDQAIKRLEMDIENPPKSINFPWRTNTERNKEILEGLKLYKSGRAIKELPKEIVDSVDFRCLHSECYLYSNQITKYEGELINLDSPREGAYVYQLGVIERDYSVLDFEKSETTEYLEVADPIRMCFATEMIAYDLDIRDNPIDGNVDIYDISSIKEDEDLFIINWYERIKPEFGEDEDIFIGTLNDVKEFLLTAFKFSNVYEDIKNNIKDTPRFSIRVSEEPYLCFNVYKYVDLDFIEDFGY